MCFPQKNGQKSCNDLQPHRLLQIPNLGIVWVNCNEPWTDMSSVNFHRIPSCHWQSLTAEKGCSSRVRKCHQIRDVQPFKSKANCGMWLWQPQSLRWDLKQNGGVVKTSQEVEHTENSRVHVITEGEDGDYRVDFRAASWVLLTRKYP